MTDEIMADRMKQLDDFYAEVKAGGWTIYKPEEWKKIEARYRADLDLAETVPRKLIYWDIAMLVGHIMNLEQELVLANRMLNKKAKKH